MLNSCEPTSVTRVNWTHLCQRNCADTLLNATFKWGAELYYASTFHSPPRPVIVVIAMYSNRKLWNHWYFPSECFRLCSQKSGCRSHGEARRTQFVDPKTAAVHPPYVPSLCSHPIQQTGWKIRYWWSNQISQGIQIFSGGRCCRIRSVYELFWVDPIWAELSGAMLYASDTQSLTKLVFYSILNG